MANEYFDDFMGAGAGLDPGGMDFGGDPMAMGGGGYDPSMGQDPSMGGDPMAGMDQSLMQFAMGMGQPAQQPVPQVDGGETSWFKQAMSGLMSGMASGAASPDPMTAFAKGYQGVQMQRQQELQMAQMEQALQQKQHTQDLANTQSFLKNIELAQKISMAPEGVQLEWAKLAVQNKDVMVRAGARPLGEVADDPDILAAKLESLKAVGYDTSRIVFEDYGNTVHVFERPQGGVMPKGSVYEYKSPNTGKLLWTTDVSGDDFDLAQKQIQSDREAWIKMIGQEEDNMAAEKRANIQASASRYGADAYSARPSATGMPTAEDKQRMSIDNIKLGITKLKNDADDFQRDFEFNAKSADWTDMNRQIQRGKITQEQAAADPRFGPLLKRQAVLQQQIQESRQNQDRGIAILAQITNTQQAIGQMGFDTGQKVQVTIPESVPYVGGQSLQAQVISQEEDGTLLVQLPFGTGVYDPKTQQLIGMR